MHILITGAGEVGFLIASELHEDHDVTVIDKDPEACARLQDMDVKVLQGNSANARLLLEAEVKKADIVVAVTGNDEVNVITCVIASHLGVRQTIARVSNPEYIDQPVQDRKEIGISYMICPELSMAEEMARSLYFPSMLMNRDLANGLVGLIEFKVTPGMNILGPVEKVSFPRNCNTSIPSSPAINSTNYKPRLPTGRPRRTTSATKSRPAPRQHCGAKMRSPGCASACRNWSTKSAPGNSAGSS